MSEHRECAPCKEAAKPRVTPGMPGALSEEQLADVNGGNNHFIIRHDSISDYATEAKSSGGSMSDGCGDYRYWDGSASPSAALTQRDLLNDR